MHNQVTPMPVSPPPIDQKAVRIQGLLERLFSVGIDWDGPFDYKKILSPKQEEELAAFFEKQLVLYYQDKRKEPDFLPGLNEIFQETNTSQDIIEQIAAHINEAIKRIDKGFGRGKDTVFEDAQAKNKEMAHMMTMLGIRIPSLYPLFTIARESFENAEFQTDQVVKLMHLYGLTAMTDELEGYTTPPPLKEEILFFRELAKTHDHFENTRKKNLEAWFFNKGLLPVEEITPMLRRLSFKYSTLSNGLQMNGNALSKIDPDLDYLILQYNDCVSTYPEFRWDYKSMLEACTRLAKCEYFEFSYYFTKIRLLEIVQNSHQSVREYLLRAAAKYDTQKDELSAEELVVIMYVNGMESNAFIREHRAEFDELCVKRGLKKSLICKEILTKSPFKTFEDFCNLAKIAPLVLLSPQGQSFNPRRGPFDPGPQTDQVIVTEGARRDGCCLIL